MPFEQGGQVDWVSIASKAVSVPIGIMGRLALAGVDVYTLEVSKHFGTIISLPESYTSRIEKQLVQSPKFFLNNEVLFAGCGISSVPRELAKTSGGVSMAALTVALRNSFPRRHAAKVLHEMVKASCPESARRVFVIPSVSQFEALSDEIVAVATDNDFHDQLAAIKTLKGQSIQSPLLKFDAQYIPDAFDLAHVILGLAALDRDPKDSAMMLIMAVPGISPLWIATFASKIMGLRVYFEESSEVIVDILNSSTDRSAGPSGKLVRIACSSSLDHRSTSTNHRGVDSRIFLPAQITIKLSATIHHSGRQENFEQASLPQLVAQYLSHLSLHQRSYVIAVVKAHLERIVAWNITFGSKFGVDIRLPRPDESKDEIRNTVKISDIVAQENFGNLFNVMFGEIGKHEFEPKFEISEDLEVATSDTQDGSKLSLEDKIAIEIYGLAKIPPLSLVPGVHEELFPSLYQELAVPLIERFQALMFLDSSVPLESLYFNKSVFAKRHEDHFSLMRHDFKRLKAIPFRLVLYHIFALFQGKHGVNLNTKWMKLHEPIGISANGQFAIIPSAIDPNLSMAENLKVKVGKGGLYLNGKLVLVLDAFNPKIGTEQTTDWYMHPRIKGGKLLDVNADITTLKLTPLSESPICQYSPRFEPWYEANNDSGGIMVYAWACSLRDGMSLIFNVIKSPIDLIVVELDNTPGIWKPSGSQVQETANVSSSGNVEQLEVYYPCDQKWILSRSTKTSIREMSYVTVVKCHRNHACLSLIKLAIGNNHTFLYSSPGETFEKFLSRAENVRFIPTSHRPCMGDKIFAIYLDDTYS